MKRLPLSKFDREIMEFLMKDELGFNEEIHNLASGAKLIEMLPPGPPGKSGWVLTFAETAAGEWNLAHGFGSCGDLMLLLKRFPRGEEFQLLVPADFSKEFSDHLGKPPVEDLIWFRDGLGDSGRKAAEKGLSSFPGDLKLVVKEEAEGVEVGPGDPWYHLNLYLTERDAIVSLVKTIHSTPHSVEVYIETSPGSRGKGLGRWLLGRFIEMIQERGIRLIYVTSEANPASMRVAGYNGLVRHQVLSRFPFCNNP